MKTGSNLTRNYLPWLLLLLLAISIKILSLDPLWVENVYYGRIFPVIGKTLRTLFGWLPFSLGDLLYALFAGWLIWQISLFIKMLYNKRVNKSYLLKIIKKIFFISFTLYALFYSLWGLNYNRLGIAHQLQLEVKEYNRQDLVLLDSLLRERANHFKLESSIETSPATAYKTIFQKAYQCYDSSLKDYPFLRYDRESLKPVLLSSVMAHLGFLGHYNPFTGEAQVNTDVPNFLLPFTTCHEIGHQLGYAKEYEANFAGYLAARHSGNPYFKYSTYLDLYLYTNTELFRLDSNYAKQSRQKLVGPIQDNLKEWRKYREQHRSPIEPLAEKFYGTFLKLNEQPAGIRSYNKVVLWLLAYQRKYGVNAL